MRALLLFLLSSVAQAASPYLVTGPLDSRATHCGIYIDAAPKVVSPVFASGGSNICHHDLSAVSVGSHSVTATTIIIDPLWGNQESPQSSPLAFVRPSPAAIPSGLQLAP